MSRIRTIKPEFWASEQVLECSMNARLMFIGLWNFCDDLGRHSFSPKTIKAEVFPGDDITSENILGMLNELSENGLITVYRVDNKDILQVTGWHHQRIDHPQKARFPRPFDEPSKSDPQNSENIHGTLAPESKGVESKGKEGKGVEGRVARARDPLDDNSKNVHGKRDQRKPKSDFSENDEPSETQRADAKRKGLADEEFWAEWTKFGDYNLAKGNRLSDWDAAWRQWLDKMPKFGAINGHRIEDKDMPAKHLSKQELEQHKESHRIYVRQHTPAGEAWAEWTRKELGKSQVWDATGGWWFPSEYPPPRATDC